MVNEKNDCTLVEWAVICRDLHQHRWMGGQYANTDRGKQSISAVRVSGGFPGNVMHADDLMGLARSPAAFMNHQFTVASQALSGDHQLPEFYF